LAVVIFVETSRPFFLKSVKNLVFFLTNKKIKMPRIVPVNSYSTEEKPQIQNEHSIKHLAFLFDSTVGNFPLGAAIALVITITGTVFIVNGMGTCSMVLSEYQTNPNQGTHYLYMFLAALNLLHGFVFLHGLSVGWLETSREWFHAKDIGCYCGPCKDKNTPCGNTCRKVQKCNRTSCQVLWGVFGTLTIFGYYLFALCFFTLSTVSTFFSYVLTQTCHAYETQVGNNIEKTRVYLNQAKQYIGKADNATQQIIYQYNRLVTLQDMMENNAMAQVTKIESPTYFKAPQPKEEWGRHLSTIATYDPMTSMAHGQSILSTLNETIYHTEQQLYRCEEYFQKTVQFCMDYANLYDNFYMVSVGTLLLLISHFIIFAVHYKYFTVWNYEARLLKNEDYD